MADIKNLEITEEDVNMYIANGGDLTLLTATQLRKASRESINQYVANGGILDYLTTEQRASIPQDSINRYVLNGGDVFQLTDSEIDNLSYLVINEYVVSGGEVWYLTANQRGRISQISINGYVANGGDLSHLTEEERKNVPQESINGYVANGGDLSHLTEEERKNVPQESINGYVASGGWLGDLTPEERSAVSRESFNQYVVKCGLGGLSLAESSAVTQESINQYVARGHFADVKALTDEKRKAVSEEAKKLYLVNGGELTDFPEEERVYSPLGGAIARISGGYRDYQNDRAYGKLGVPNEILEPGIEGRKALILYGAGKIQREDLPSSVFVDRQLRTALLGIIKAKNINNFNKLCDKLGYKDVVPDEVVQAFDEKCVEIEKDVTRRQLEAIDEYEALGQGRKKAAADEIQEWSW